MATPLYTLEAAYRHTNITHKKHSKRLTNYIEGLIESGRFLEAKHFFDRLFKENNTHPKTIRLGYTLGIHLFDIDEVKKYDKLLCNEKPLSADYFSLRLKYFHSISHLEGIEESCTLLLSKTATHEHLTTVIEVCIKQENYEIAAKLAIYLSQRKLTLTKNGNEDLKKIMIKKLLEKLASIKNE